MTKRLSTLVALLMLIGAACTSSGNPDDYDETVRDNFIEACSATGEDTQLGDALAATCVCAYEKFVDNVPYEEFKAFDDDLRSDIDAPFPDEYATFFADCIREAA